MEMMLLSAVLSSFILAPAAPWVQRLYPRSAGRLLSLLPMILTVFFACRIGDVSAGRALSESIAWVPGLSVSLSFYLDGLSLIFSLLISGIGTLIFIYSGKYLAGNQELGRFYVYLLIFMGSMLGIVLADNLLTVFVFWELTSFSSYLLIGFEHRRESARDGALQALLVTGVGGLALLAGFLLLGYAGDSPELSTLLNRGDIVRTHELYLPALILILIGAFTKSAQFPFHFWLPSAMEGPSPVSAFLHSATMVKAGVYLLLRLNPVLGGTDVWQLLVTATGTLTMVSGAAIALVQTDMKRLLAYSTVNGLGTMVMLTGLGSPLAIQAALVFLMGHALYKGSLFLSAGVVDHHTGSRDVTRLCGLARQMPVIAAAAVLAGLSMAGLPPLLGFIGKELIYESLLPASITPILLTGSAVTANALLMAATGVLVIRPFFGSAAEAPHDHHGIPPDLWAGPVVPAVMGLLLGLAPGLLDQWILSPAVGAVLNRAAAVHLKLWHGFTPALALSVITVAAGIGVYAGRFALRHAISRWLWIGRLGPNRWYEALLFGLKRVSEWQTRLLQSGYLRHYVATILLTTILLVSITILTRVGPWRPAISFDVRFFEAVIAGLMLTAAFVTIRSTSRLSAIVAMGVIGYGIALIFIDFGAPDLAMTQFVIETMTVILFVLVIYRLPRFARLSEKKDRVRNAAAAIGSGVLMTVLVLLALSIKESARVSDYYIQNSLSLAHGRNIVNVIIVDFRGMDTLGEITVLALAGAGVYTLLKLKPKQGG